MLKVPASSLVSSSYWEAPAWLPGCCSAAVNLSVPADLPPDPATGTAPVPPTDTSDTPPTATRTWNHQIPADGDNPTAAADNPTTANPLRRADHRRTPYHGSATYHRTAATTERPPTTARRQPPKCHQPPQLRRIPRRALTRPATPQLARQLQPTSKYSPTVTQTPGITTIPGTVQ